VRPPCPNLAALAGGVSLTGLETALSRTPPTIIVNTTADNQYDASGPSRTLVGADHRGKPRERNGSIRRAGTNQRHRAPSSAGARKGLAETRQAAGRSRRRRSKTPRFRRTAAEAASALTAADAAQAHEMFSAVHLLARDDHPRPGHRQHPACCRWGPSAQSGTCAQFRRLVRRIGPVIVWARPSTKSCAFCATYKTADGLRLRSALFFLLVGGGRSRRLVISGPSQSGGQGARRHIQSAVLRPASSNRFRLFNPVQGSASSRDPSAVNRPPPRSASTGACGPVE